MRRGREREDLGNPQTDSYTHGSLKWQNKSTETRLRITFHREQTERDSRETDRHTHRSRRTERPRKDERLESLSCWGCCWSCMPSQVPTPTGCRSVRRPPGSARQRASARRMASYCWWTAPNKDYPPCRVTWVLSHPTCEYLRLDHLLCAFRGVCVFGWSLSRWFQFGFLRDPRTFDQRKNAPAHAKHESHARFPCDRSRYGGIWWERVYRVMQWGAPYSIGFLRVSWKPVGFKSTLIAKACHMSPDCEWWRRGGLKCSLIKRCAAHVNQ